MFRSIPYFSAGLIGSIPLAYRQTARMDAILNGDSDSLSAQPSFGATINLSKQLKNYKRPKITLNSVAIIGGTGHRQLGEEIAELMGVRLIDSEISRFADGEVSIKLNENLRGKDVFIIQTCASPVNDNIFELLLSISTAKRAGAERVTAVIPYFGYKHHRRGMSSSTKHQSRFLSSFAMDFAKMLTEMGVDRVVAVDLQRPGQGHEACLFDNSVPLEAIITTDYMLEQFVATTVLSNPIVVVTPNSECVKKARKFQLRLRKAYNRDVKIAAFFHTESGSGPTDVEKLELLLGKSKIEGSDIVIVDDMIDTAGTIFSLSNRLKEAGAANIYVCASHGLFSADAMQHINNGCINKVMVTNSLPLPADASSKIVQVSVAPLIAKVMLTEHFRSNIGDEDNYEMD